MTVKRTCVGKTDCSQVATAERLGTHKKTIPYRVAKITALTGLDLAQHQDCVLADIGIRLCTMLDSA
jgi:DNA-binding PucR family transcriptional regulator